jgi:hypothetical protein
LLTLATAHDRLADVVSHVRGLAVDPAEVRGLPVEEPQTVEAGLAQLLPGRVVLGGTIERRLLVAEQPDLSGWTVADLSGGPLESWPWPSWIDGRVRLDRPGWWLSPAVITDEGVWRLLRPRVLLVALYHPEFFPLPRFPLGISDLARAARSTLLGRVWLMDMQLGVTLPDIQDAVASWRPDIVGVSATFGQHDIVVRLLDHLFDLPEAPLVLAGGSLTARNEQLLLDRYPRLWVARGAGEPTMQDVLGYWHGDLALSQVRGLGHADATRNDGTLRIGRYRRTATVPNRLQTDTLPELDLLGATFAHRGVAQLETSRGCTNYCSFCPRGHKGQWSGAVPQALPSVLAAMRGVFDRYPNISRTLYLVDEEFIGGGDDAVTRALAVADTVHRAGFRWESSCRVDQVVDPDRDRAWHVQRGGMWRGLLDRGLRRMLFGVESGVTSILERFTKETTGEQNALAIRTLSALGVPTRFTYITFDQLMSLAELRATHAFQGRTDLLLHPLPDLSVEEIVDGVRDEQFVAAHATGRPFHTAISYLLVSMECLIGAAYTKRVQAVGLAGAPRPAMGRVDARFADWRIGRSSHHAQLWIDRNFALDYTLKSLEKILDGQPRHIVRGARGVLKDAAYALLGHMLDLIDRYPLTDDERPDEFDAGLLAVMDVEIRRLQDRMASTVQEVAPGLPADAAWLLVAEHRRWESATGWRLINAADPCGT